MIKNIVAITRRIYAITHVCVFLLTRRQKNVYTYYTFVA